MSPSEELTQWLETVSDKVRNNVTVVTPEDVRQDYFLHISTNTAIKKFIPVIGRRQAYSEDRTVPRVTVAPTLLGCFIGYAKADYDFQNHRSNGKPDQSGYKGGWKIYALPFEAALKPGARMVYDSRISDEHWLVSYSRETNEYIPVQAGKMFYRSLRLVSQSGKLPQGEMELYVEVTLEGGFKFSKNHFLNPGFYRIVGPVQQNVKSWTDDKDYVVTPIDKADYLSAKNAAADLLGLTDGIPPHLHW
jgi:hypothetical protein